MLKSSATVGVLLVTLLLSGCTYTRLTRYGNDLTRRELEPAGLAIAAVTALGGGEAAPADAIATQIEKRFRSARPWLHVQALTSVRTNFNAVEYQQALRQISEGEDWSPVDLEFFSRLTNHTRYLLLVNLRGQREHQGSYQSPNAISLAFAFLWSAIFDHDSDYSSDEWDDSGPEIQMDTTKYGTLTLETQLGIYDLQTRKMVWLASVKTKLREAETFLNDDPRIETTEAPSPSGLEAVGKAVKVAAGRLPK